MNELVSIVTPVYNSESYLKETFESIKKQTYSNWEWLLIDDCSQDNSRDLMKELALRDQRIKTFYLQENAGPAVARNIGISNAKGRFIAFLDSDDLWLPSKLKIQLDFMQKNAYSVTFSSYLLIDEQGVELKKKVEALPEIDYKKILKANYIGNLTGIYDTEKLGKIYSTDIKKRQDWGLWIQVLQKSKKAGGYQGVLAKYRVRQQSVSSNKWKLLKYNYLVYRKSAQFSVVKSIVYLIVFLSEHFFVKKRLIKNY